MTEFRYYIYVYYQRGNCGDYNCRTIEEQPKEGFDSEINAEKHLIKLIDKKHGYFFDRPWYKFTILKTYNSKNALKGN